MKNYNRPEKTLMI